MVVILTMMCWFCFAEEVNAIVFPLTFLFFSAPIRRAPACAVICAVRMVTSRVFSCAIAGRGAVAFVWWGLYRWAFHWLSL